MCELRGFCLYLIRQNYKTNRTWSACSFWPIDSTLLWWGCSYLERNVTYEATLQTASTKGGHLLSTNQNNISLQVRVESVSWYNSLHYQFPTPAFPFTKLILMPASLASFGLVYFLQKHFLKLHCVSSLLLFFPSSPLCFSVKTKHVDVILMKLGSVLFIEISQLLAPLNIYQELNKYIIVKFINVYVLFWLTKESVFSYSEISILFYDTFCKYVIPHEVPQFFSTKGLLDSFVF